MRDFFIVILLALIAFCLFAIAIDVSDLSRAYRMVHADRLVGFHPVMDPSDAGQPKDKP